MSNENEANNPAQDSLRAPEARLKEAREDIVADERRAVLLVSACFVIIGYFLSFDFAATVGVLSDAGGEIIFGLMGAAFYSAGLLFLMAASWLGMKCFNLKDSESEITEEDLKNKIDGAEDVHSATLEKLRNGQRLLQAGFICACIWQILSLLVELIPQ